MTTSDIAVLISMGSAVFGIINAIASKNSAAVGKIARLEQTIEGLDNIVSRVTRLEVMNDVTGRRLNDIEIEIKDILLEVKSISLEILKATVR